MADLFIAHRGAPRQGRRENSIAAFQRAAESGRFAYIEMDVRRTRADDELETEAIIAHDPSVDRIYDLQRRPKTKRKYSGLALAALTKKMIRRDAIEIPTLAEVLRALNPHPINLEIKNPQSIKPTLTMLNDLIEFQTKAWRWEDFTVSAFNWQILQRVRQLEPRLAVALLYGFNNLLHNPFRSAHRLSVRFVNIHKMLAPIISPLLILSGIEQRYVYSVNMAWEVRLLKLFGVNGFTTDNVTLPEKFRS